MSERPVVLMVRPGHTPALVLPGLEAAKASNPGFPLKAFAYGEDPNDWARAFQEAAHAIGVKSGMKSPLFRGLKRPLIRLC